MGNGRWLLRNIYRTEYDPTADMLPKFPDLATAKWWYSGPASERR